MSVRVRVGDDVVDSAIALVGPPRSRSARPTCEVELVRRLPCRPRAWTALPGTEDLWVGRSGGWVVACLDGAADLAVSQDGRRVQVRPHDALDTAALSHLVLDIALPLRLAVLGRTVLHATAVCRGDDAVAFAAASGTGKSTLAMAWCARGASLLADDCLVVRRHGRDARLLAVPSYPGSRLRPDSARHLFASTALTDGAAGKRFVHPRDGIRFSRRAVPLSVVVVLERIGAREAVSIERVEPVVAFDLLRHHLFFADLTQGPGRVQVLHQLAQVIDATEVVVVRCPSDLDRLDEVIDAIDTLAPGTSG